MLISTIQQSESAVSIHISPLYWTSLPPHPIPLGHHRAPGWAPCVIQQLPTSYLFFTVVNICQCYSLGSSNPLFPLLPPQVHSLHLHLHSFPANRFISTISLASIYMSWYIIFVFLLVTYLILNNRLQVHLPHYNWLKFIPFYGWVIFLCICVPHLCPFICWWTSRLLPCPDYCK